MADSWEIERRCIATWISKPEFEALKGFADSNNVTVASFVRSIIVDAINDETDRKARLASLKTVAPTIPRIRISPELTVFSRIGLNQRINK